MSLKVLYESATSEEIIHRVRVDLRACSAHYSRVLFDPIFTPIFTALFTPIFGAGTALTTFAVGAATAIATTALTVGLQLLLAPSVRTPKPEDGKVPKTQSIPYRWWGVGRTRVAGAYMLWEAKGKRLFAVQGLVGHRIKAINRYFLHDDEVTIGSGNIVNGLADGRYGNGTVQLFSRLGANPETAYAAVVAGIPESWTSAHRGDGQASVAMICSTPKQKDFSKRFPYNAPSVSVEADLAYCWDFRDPAQNPANPATWAWTQNCAVILAWHLCFNEFGERLDYTKAILPVLDIWIEEANICDEDVPLAGGGTEKRYQCNGYDTTENGPKAATNAILAACDGHLVSRGDGARILTVGKFRESRCGVLTDADIVGHNIQYDVLFEDEINRLIPKFTYPAIDYATADTDYFEDTAAQLEAGRVLAQEAEYTWVHQWRQARRLAKREWLRIREKVRGSIDVRLSGINAVYCRWNRLVTPNRLPRLNNKIIENRRALLSITRGGFSMDIVQHPGNIDAWNPAADEGRQPPVPPAPNAAGMETPVINLVQAKSNSGSIYIRVVIIDPEDDSMTPAVRYRVADADGLGNPGAWIEQRFPDATPAGGYIDLATNTVPADKLLNIQVAFIASSGRYSDWSVTADIVSTIEWTPLDLGSKLVAWWDAESGVSRSGSQVTAWADRKAGYSAAQAASGSRPTWSATSFVGKPSITFDGVNDELTCTDASLLAALPKGSSPVELWGVVDQAALPADTANRIAVWYGNDSLQSVRILRTVTGGVNRASLNIGTGSGATAVTNTAVDFTGRHVIRGAVGSAAGQMDIDGNPSAQVAAVPSTGSKLLRIGANDVGSVAGAFWNGKIRDVLVTLPLGPDELTAMNTWASGRVA